ncbi:hypothetical protein V8F06_007893 [Rhypophila decipiens]
MGLFGGSEDTLLGRIGFANNLDEPVPAFNRRETILGLCISFLIVSWVCVGFRLYARFHVIKSPGWDDLFVVLSLITMTIGKIAVALATNHGMGQHIILLSKTQIATYQQTFYVANATYSMSTALIKISLLLQYTRLYHPSSSLHKTCRFLILFTALWGIAYSIMAWVPCVPVSSYWEQIYHYDDPLFEPATCYAYGSQLVSVFKATYESHAAVNMALDLLVMGLPVPLYFQIGTPLKTKMALVGILVMGAFVNLFAMWRFITMVQHKSCTEPTFDPTWYGSVSIVMAALETSAACICASIPIFWRNMIDSASEILGHIFVTKEVKVTTQNRLDAGFRDSGWNTKYCPGNRNGNGDSSHGGKGGMNMGVLELGMGARQHRGFHDLEEMNKHHGSGSGGEEIDELEMGRKFTRTSTSGSRGTRSQEGYDGNTPAAETVIARTWMDWATTGQEQNQGQRNDQQQSSMDLRLSRIKSFEEWRFSK